MAADGRLLLNQMDETPEHVNAAPRINGVAVDGRTVKVLDMDPTFLPFGQDMNTGLSVIAPDIGEEILITVQASDRDVELLDVTLATLNPTLPQPVLLVNRTWSWSHDQEGTYGMLATVTDQSGGEASFQFTVIVWKGEGDL